jgi:dienelactone hydrolase
MVARNVLRAFILFMLCAPVMAQVQWVGEYRLGGPVTPLVIQQNVKESKVAAELPLMGMRGLEVQSFNASEGRLRFQLPTPEGALVFDAPVRGGRAEGTVVRGENKGTFTLVRTEAVSSALVDEYTGSYRISKDHIIDMGPMDEIGGQLVFLDHKTLKEGALYPLSANEMVSGETLGVPYPFAVRAVFERDRRGRVRGLRWSGEGVKNAFAKKIAPHVKEDVEVKNGDVTLRGTLLVPASKGPHPAVIFAHGSGDATRNLAMWNTFFVRLGIAVLSLDKRGAGASTGDWHTASMDDIAGDWLAGIEMLKKRPDIDPKRIGVHGSSQGGWTAPLMAARSSDVAFVIVRAGSGQNVRDTMLYEIAWNARDAGFSEAEVAEAVAASAAVFDLTAQGAPWEQIAAITEPAKKQRWANEAWPIWGSEKGWGRVWNKLNSHYDSADALRKVRVPVLWFFGDKDHNVDSAAGEPRVRAALEAAGNNDFAIRTLRNASHGFTESTTGRNADFPLQSRMAAGYWSEMETWLRKRFLKGR